MLKRLVSCIICASTKKALSVTEDGLVELKSMRTEHLIWFPEAECEAILLHKLTILFRAFSSHQSDLVGTLVCFRTSMNNDAGGGLSNKIYEYNGMIILYAVRQKVKV